MSENIELDGKTYLPAARAAKHVGVTRDYIGRLCREGKITGRRVGSTWYVEAASLDELRVSQQYVKAKRAHELSTERLVEYRARQGEVSVQETPAASPILHAARISTIVPALVVAAIVPEPVIAVQQNAAETLRAAGRTVGASAVARAFLEHAPRALYPTVQAVAQSSGLAHRLFALAFAFALTFGAYGFVDAQYRTVAFETAREGALALAGAPVQVQQLALRASADAREFTLAAPSKDDMVASTAGFASGFVASVDQVRTTLADAFSSLVRSRSSLAFLFPQLGPTATVSISVTSASSGTPLAAAPVTVVRPVERVIEHTTQIEHVASANGISSEFLTASLQGLENKLTSQMYSLFNANSSSDAATYQAVAQTQRIDRLNGTILDNVTVNGISGLTPSDIPALSYFPATSTISLSFGGTGTSTAPAYGKMLLGNSVGGYDLVATSTLTQFNGGLTAYASSTIGSGVQNAGLTIFGGATTTGNAYFAGNVGIGTSTPWGLLSVNPNVLATGAPAFVVGSTTKTSFIVTANNNSGFGTTTPWGKLSVDTSSVDAGTPTFVVGSSSRTSFIVTQAGSIGLSTTTPWGRLSIDTSNLAIGLPEFTVGSSTRTDFVITQAGNVGIGTTTPGTPLDISSTIADAARLTGYAVPAGYQGRRAAGSPGSPTAVQSGQTLMRFTGIGYGATGWSGIVGQVSIQSAENFTDTAQGSQILFNTTPIGTTVMTEAMRITSAGNLGIASTTPWAQLSVNPTSALNGAPAFVVGSSTATSFIVTNSGSVGIGTTTAGTDSLVNVYSQAGFLGGNGIKISTATDVPSGYSISVAGKQWQFSNRGSGEANAFSIYYNNGVAWSPAALTVLPSGNVGIGTTGPGAKLEVNGAERLSGWADPTSGVGLELGWYGNTQSNIQSYDRTNSVAKPMSFLASAYYFNTGNVGIGTASPATPLEVNGALKFTNASADTNDGRIGSALFAPGLDFVGINTDASYRKISIWGGITQYENGGGNSFAGITQLSNVRMNGIPAGTATYLLYWNGNQVSYAAAGGGSSIRFKHDITSLSATTTLSEVMQLRPVSFIYNASYDPTDDTNAHVGFVAEEVNQIDSRLVTFEKDGVTPYGLQYANFTALLAGAIQEQQGELNALLASADATSTPASTAFASSFFSSLFGRMTAWLADSGNGITDLFATTLHAQNVYADTVHAKTLCLDDICVTKDQLQALLTMQANGSSQLAAVASVASGSSVSSSTPVITVLGANPAEVALNAPYSDLGATAKDSQGHDLTVHLALDGVAVNSITINTATSSTHTVTYSATDGNNLTTTATRTVTVGTITPTTQGSGSIATTATSTPVAGTAPSTPSISVPVEATSTPVATIVATSTATTTP